MATSRGVVAILENHRGADPVAVDHDFSPHPGEVPRREPAPLRPVVVHDTHVGMSESSRQVRRAFGLGHDGLERIPPERRAPFQHDLTRVARPRVAVPHRRTWKMPYCHRNVFMPLFHLPPMAEVVSVDRAGRIVIPKSIRKAAGISDRAKLLIAVTDSGRVVLQKLDVESLAARIEQEMAGKDVDAIARKVRKEVDARIREKYPDLLA